MARPALTLSSLLLIALLGEATAAAGAVTSSGGSTTTTVPTNLTASTSSTASVQVICADNDSLSNTAERKAKLTCLNVYAPYSGLQGDSPEDVFPTDISDWLLDVGFATTSPTAATTVIDGVSYPAAYLSSADAALHGVPALSVSVGDFDGDGTADLALSAAGTLSSAIITQTFLSYDTFDVAATSVDEQISASSTLGKSSTIAGVTYYSYTVTSGTDTVYGLKGSISTTFSKIIWKAPRKLSTAGPMGF